MEEKVSDNRSPEEEMVETDPIPHLQRILQIDDDDRDRGDGKTEGLQISQRETVGSRRVGEREIRDEKDDARGDHSVQNTDDEHFGVEKRIVGTRFVPEGETSVELPTDRISDQLTDGVVSRHVQR